MMKKNLARRMFSAGMMMQLALGGLSSLLTQDVPGTNKLSSSANNPGKRGKFKAWRDRK